MKTRIDHHTGENTYTVVVDDKPVEVFDTYGAAERFLMRLVEHRMLLERNQRIIAMERAKGY